jgi:hypothetical protein
MSDEPAPDLTLLARQQKQILAELGILRDDMRVMSAILMRVDGTLAGPLQEVRAMHSRHDRLANRVSELEVREQT